MSSSEESDSFGSLNRNTDHEVALRSSRRIALAGHPQSFGRSETLNLAIESQLTTVRNIIQDTVQVVDRTPEDFAGFDQRSEVTSPVGARIAALRLSAFTSQRQPPRAYAQSIVSSRISLFTGQTGSLENISLTKDKDWATGLPVRANPLREQKRSVSCPSSPPREDENSDTTPLQTLNMP